MLGGLAGAVFYLPFKKVKNWAWESYWWSTRYLACCWCLGFSRWRLPRMCYRSSGPARDEMIYCLCAAPSGVSAADMGMISATSGSAWDCHGGRADSAAGTLIPPCSKGKEAVANMFGTSAGRSRWPRAGAVAGIVAGRHGRHVQGKRTAGGGEEKRKTVAEFNSRGSWWRSSPD